MAALLASQHLGATSIRPVTLESLFAEADQVALVKVVAGDTERYDIAVYKAIVETAYKSANTNETIYFGPYVSVGLGDEYILFLKTGRGEKPKAAAGLSFGDIKTVDRVMYAGYSALRIGYDCVFDGAEISQQCDYSVQLNPKQIILPKSIKTFPAGHAGAVTNYKKWVRKGIFQQELEILREAQLPAK